MEKLTVEQRRMVIDYYATKLVEEWPAELTGLEVEQRVQDGHLDMCVKLGRYVASETYANLIEFMLDQQTFDRDPAGWLNENGYADTSLVRGSKRVYLAEMVSVLINDIAGV